MRTMFKNYFKLLVFLGVFVGSWLAGFDVGAQTYWTGAVSNDWNNDANWTNFQPSTTNPGFITADPSGTNDDPQLTAGESVLSLFISAGRTVDLNGQFLTVGTTLTVGDQTPFANLDTETGIVVFNNSLPGVTGPLSIQRIGNGDVDIPRLGVAGASSLSFVTGTNVNLTRNAGGAANPILLIDASAAAGDFGIDAGENGILRIDATGDNTIELVDANANASPQIGIGDLGGTGTGLGSVVFTSAGTVSIENTGAGLNSRLTIWSDLVLEANTIIQQEPTAGDATVLRLNADFTNNSTANPILQNGANVYGQLIFSNTLNNQTISGNFMTISHLHVTKANGDLILNTSVTLDGSADATHGLITERILEISGGVSDINLNGANVTLTLDPNNATGDEVFMSNVPPGGNEIYGTGTFAIESEIGGNNAVLMVSDLVVNSNMRVGRTADDGSVLDFNGVANQLYFGGDKMDIYDHTAFTDANGNYIQFVGSNFQTVTTHDNDEILELPALEIAKSGNDANAVFLTAAADNTTTVDFQIATHNGTADRIIVFTSSDDFGNFASTGLSQLLISQDVVLATNVANGDLEDETDGNGNISGAGDFQLNAATQLESNFAIGADLLLNNLALTLGTNNLLLGGDILDGLTVGDAGAGTIVNADGVADDEFVTIGTVSNGSGNTSLDIAALSNVVMKRTARVEQDINITVDGAAAGTSLVIFDGGSFTSANEVTLTLEAADQDIHFTTTNTGMFANQFVTIAGAFELDLNVPTAFNSVNFTSSGTGLFASNAANVIDVDANDDTFNHHVVLGGDLINDGAQDLFRGLNANDFLIFDVPAVAVNGSNGFTTVGVSARAAGDGLSVERLKIQSARTYAPAAGNLQCFNPDLEFTSGVLTFTTGARLIGPASNNVLLDLSQNGFVSVAPVGVDGAALTLAVDGNIATAVDPNYSAIVGGGWLVFGGNNQFTPTGGNIIMGIRNWTNTVPLALTGELAMTGNLFITIDPINSTETGAVRLIGGEFQTVAPGRSVQVTATGIAAGAEMGFIPNLIIDKCQTGNFVTAFQSAGWNMVIGRTGTNAGDPHYGFMSVQSGIFAMNGFTTIVGNGNDGGLFISAYDNPIAAGEKGTFITSNTSLAGSSPYSLSGINLGNVINSAAADAYQMISVTSNQAFATVSIPNLVIGHANSGPVGRGANIRVQRSGSLTDLALSVFNTASTYDEPALYLAVDNSNSQGNLNLYDNDLFITGGGNVVVRQENNNAAGFGSLHNGNNYVQTNYGIVMGDVTSLGAGTSMEMTTVTRVGLATLEASRFTIDGNLTLNQGGVTLNNSFLELRKNLFHNSFATAFVTGGASGVLQMTGADASINFLSAELQIPSLLIDNVVNVFNTAGANFTPGTNVGGNLVLGTGRALPLPNGAVSFATVLDIGNKLMLNGAFLTITGQGGHAEGLVDGGGKEGGIIAANNGGGVRIDAFVTVGNNNLTFKTAGVYIVDGTNVSVPTALGRVHTQANTLTLGGYLYEQTGATSTTGTDAFITTNNASSTGGLVVFDCLANTTQFISSNGGPAAIMANVLINGNEVTLGAGSTATETTNDNVQLYLGGEGFTTAKATLSLANGGTADAAKLNLGFNSVIFLAGNGALIDDDNRVAGETSMIGFGTVMVTPNVTAMITVGTHFGIADDLISDGTNPQINLGGNNLFLGGDYANNTNLTKAFITATTDDASTLVLNGTAFQTISLTGTVGLQANGTSTFTEVPHIRVAGIGTTLASDVAVYGGAGDALYLDAPLYLSDVTGVNSFFLTVTNEGTQLNAVYAAANAFISGNSTAGGGGDGLYFKTSNNIKTVTLRSNLTVLEAEVLIHDGHTVNMDANHTLAIGGDLASWNGAAVSTTNGGASITSSDANGHGWVKFITSIESTGLGLTDYDFRGINRVPALAVEMGGYVNHNQSPNGFTSITSNLSGEVLKFMSGNFNPNDDKLAVVGNGNNTIADFTTGNYQVYVADNNALGGLWIAGSGTTTMELGDYDNNNGSELMINPGLMMRGTVIPTVQIGKAGLAPVTLSGNLYIGIPNVTNTNSFLSIVGGVLELNSNNVQFMTAARLTENSAGGNSIVNSGTTNYPTTLGGATYTGNPQGVVFATAANSTQANNETYLLGLDVTNNVGTVSVELRKDKIADGFDIYGNQVNIARNYAITHNTVVATSIGMVFTSAEIGNYKSENLEFITFGPSVTPSNAGFYTPLVGAHTNGTNLATFVTVPRQVAPTVVPFNGYVTLGVKPINIFHDWKVVNGVATFDENLDAEAWEGMTTVTGIGTPNTADDQDGIFRIEYPASNAPITIFATVHGTAKYTDDYTFTVSSAQAGAIVNATTTATNGFLTITLPANSTTTFLTVNVVDDQFVEAIENVFVTLTGVQQATHVVSNRFTTASLKVYDNDAPAILVQAVNQVGNASPVYVQGTAVAMNQDATAFISVDEALPNEPFKTARVAFRLQTKPAVGGTVTVNLSLKDLLSDAYRANREARILTSAQSGTTAGGTIVNDSTYRFVFDGNTWANFVTVDIRGVDDGELDPGVTTSPFGQMFDVKIEVDQIATTAIDYKNPSSLNPHQKDNNGEPLPTSIAPITLKGINFDDEKALQFIVTRYNLAENLAGEDMNPATENGFAIRPNLVPGVDVNVTFTIDAAMSDCSKEYNADRLRLETGLSFTTTFQGLNKVGFIEFATIPVRVIEDLIDNDFETVRITAKVSPVNATESITLNTNELMVYSGMTSGQNFVELSVGDNDEYGMTDANIANVFTKNGEIFTTVVNEADKNVIGSHGIKLNTKPRAGETVFVTVKSHGPNDVQLSTKDGAEMPSVILSFNETTWNMEQFVTAHVKDDDLKEDTEELIRIEYMIANSADKCSPYSSGNDKLDTRDFYIIIKDDVNDFNNEQTDGALPAKVAGLVATPGSRQVVLNWAPNAEAGITYQVFVYQLGQPKTLVGETTSTNFTVTGLTNGVDYVFEVVAVRKDANGKIVAKGEASDAVTARPSIILGTEEANVTKLDVYPNPSNRIFNVRLANLNTKQLEVKVLSVTGQEIYTNAYGNVSGEFETAIDLANMPAGMYVLMVNTENGSFRTKLVLTR